MMEDILPGRDGKKDHLCVHGGEQGHKWTKKKITKLCCAEDKMIDDWTGHFVMLFIYFPLIPFHSCIIYAK